MVRTRHLSSTDISRILFDLHQACKNTLLWFPTGASPRARPSMERWSPRLDRPELQIAGPGRRVLVILDRNTPMGRSRGVGLIANFNLPKYPHDPASGVLHPRRNSYGSEPLKWARSVCVAEQWYRRIPPARLSCDPGNGRLIPHTHDMLSQ